MIVRKYFNMKTTLLSGLLLLLAPVVSAQSVTKLAATKANDYGLVYSLPRTVTEVTLLAECRIEEPGEFYNYAERYLGSAAADKAVQKSSTRWQLTGAEICVLADVPTGSETYLMQFKSGNPVYITVNEQGTPLTINAEFEDEIEVEESSLKGKDLTHSPLDGKSARYAVTEEMLSGSSIAKRAQLAADQIMHLRQSRQDYLTGQADNMPDGKALEMILANINAQEEALTAMFLGTVQTKSEVIKVGYIPSGQSENDVVISRLNAVKGFVAADDLSGAPIYLQYRVKSRGELPKTEKGEDKKFPKGGVPYCIPGSAEISIEYDNAVKAEREFEVSQLGVVFGLESQFFTNKKEQGYVIFNPLTGGIREMGTKE